MKTRVSIVVLMLACLAAGTLAPRPAEALDIPTSLPTSIPTPGLPTFDAANFAVNSITAGAVFSQSAAYQARKGPLGSGVGLDSIAWAVAKIALQMMIKSTVNWINSGFQGSPAFVTNPTAYLLAVSDVAANAFLQQLATNGSLHSPFQSSVAQSVSNNYYLSTSGSGGFFTAAAYTLSRLVLNDSGFLAGNFSQGGWGGWYSASVNPQNNPYGAQIIAASALAQQVANAAGTKSQQLNWGQGFLSWCGNATGGGGGASAGGSCKTDSDCGGALACIAGKCSVDASLDSNSATTCTNSDGSTGSIQTPGSVIQAQVNQTLGISGNTLVTADEFNEVIGALLSQLVGQVLGGSGLAGIGSVSSGGTGYIDQATNPNAQLGALSASQTEGTFVDGVNSTLAQVQQFQSDLQTLENAALQANQTIVSGDAPCATSSAKIVSGTLSGVQTELAGASSAITQLQGVSNDAVNAITSGAVSSSGSSGSLNGAMAAIANSENEFQTFVQSSAMPTASEMAYANTQAQVSQSDPPTVLTQLEEIINGVCPVPQPTPGVQNPNQKQPQNNNQNQKQNNSNGPADGTGGGSGGNGGGGGGDGQQTN